MPITLAWGSAAADVGSKIVGPLTLNVATAGNALTFQNGIDLAGGARSIVVGGNTVYLNGAIADSVGGGSLTKSCPGVLCIGGSAPNTYTGPTTLSGGDVYLNKSALSGYAIPGDLYFGGNTQMWVSVQSDNQIAPTSKWTWNGTGAWQEIKLFGHNQTVAGLADTTGQGAVENTWSESGYGTVTLTIDAAAGAYSFNGALRDTCFGSCGALSLVKTGAGTQTLSGGYIYFTGGTTINDGKLVLQDVTNGDFESRPVTNNGVLEIDAVNAAFSFNGPIGGSGSLYISAGNTLTLAGTSGNTYTGATTIAGTVVAAKTGGAIAIPGNLTLSETGNGGVSVLQLNGDNQLGSSCQLTFNAPLGGSRLDMNGHAQTVAAINGDSNAVIEGLLDNTGLNADSTLTVNNATDCTFAGVIRNRRRAAARAR